MTRAPFVVVSTLVLSTTLSVPLVPQNAIQRSVETNRGFASGDIDALVTQEMQSKRIPGVAVAVVEDGAIIFQRAYGLANLETETPLDTNSVFELASVTKQFTAAAVVMLVEEGKVHLDDVVRAYIAQTPPAWERITIRHLLTHTSGLDISAVPQLQGAVPLRITTAQVFEFLSQQPLRWPTGRIGWYSDAGYFLLGMVIEKASGETYRDFVTRRIFQPLGMDHSSVPGSTRLVSHRVSTYAFRGGEYLNWRLVWDYELPSFFGIFSTLQDLVTWDASLRRMTLLKPSSLKEIWTPAKLNNGQDARVYDHRYGLGWELDDVRGRPIVGHQGATGTYILRFVDEPLTIIVLSNLEVRSGERHPRLLARAIAGLVRPEYRSPHMITPTADPDPGVTSAVQLLLTDIGMRRASPVMSTAYRAWYGGEPGAQAWYALQLGGAGAVTYLGRDDLAGRSLWGGEPLNRLIHYATDVKGRTTYLSIGITLDGKVATLDFYTR